MFKKMKGVLFAVLIAGLALQGCIAAGVTVLVMHAVNKDRDTAKVTIDAPADKVYEAAIRILEKKPGVKFTEKDESDYELEAIVGDFKYSLEADPKGDDRCELVVAVRIPKEEQKEGVTPALDIVEDICKDLGIKFEVKEEKKAGDWM